eukprot:Sspe_Gene.60093::Locus_33068_Transcript_1_1_Confidence_1.000_Length_936::g.60093::m.60093
MGGLTDVPEDALRIVLAYCQFQDIVRVGETCRTLYYLSYDDELWRPICYNVLGDDSAARLESLIDDDADIGVWRGYCEARTKEKAALRLVRFVNSARESRHGAPDPSSTREFQSVRYLEFRSLCIGVNGAVCLARALQNNSCLQRLFLADQLIKDTGMINLTGALTQCPLDTLNVSGCKLSSSGIAAALRLPHLTSLDISSNFAADGAGGVGEVAKAIESKKSLRCLRMDRMGVKDKEAAELLQAAQHNSHLRCLSFRDNGMRKLATSAALRLLSKPPPELYFVDFSTTFAPDKIPKNIAK